MAEMYNVKLTHSQIQNLIEFIELDFLPSLRSDPDIDNFDYVVDMVDIYKELKTVAEYNGLRGNDNSAYKTYCETEVSDREPLLAPGSADPFKHIGLVKKDVDELEGKDQEGKLILPDVSDRECRCKSPDDDIFIEVVDAAIKAYI